MRNLEARLAAASPWLMAGLLAAFAGWIAMTRTVQQGVICGLHHGPGHCAPCYAALAFVFIGCMTFAAPAPRIRRVPARIRRSR